MTDAHPAAPAWSGRAALGPGWAVFSGHAGDNRPHRHPALQLALGDGSPVRADVEGRFIEGDGLLIGPDVAHHLHPGPVWLLYIERESDAGRRLAATCSDGVRRFSASECATLRAHWQTPAQHEARIESLVDAMTDEAAPRGIERDSVERVRAVIAALPQRDAASWTIAALATEAALSPSRFTHVFRTVTGMAVRPYLRWLRLAQALEAASRGQSLTEAAHAAGFADAAHFSRTMRRHFGVTPGSILTSLRTR